MPYDYIITSTSLASALIIWNIRLLAILAWKLDADITVA